MPYIMKVAGKDVKVTFLPAEVAVIKAPDGGDDAIGLFNSESCEIQVVTKDKSEEQLKALMLHETLHAIFNVSGIWQHLQSLDDNLEELICANLESFLAPLIEFRDDALEEVVEAPPKKKRSRKKK